MTAKGILVVSKNLLLRQIYFVHSLLAALMSRLPLPLLMVLANLFVDSVEFSSTSSSSLRSGRVSVLEWVVAHVLPLVLMLVLVWVDGVQWKSLSWLVLDEHVESTDSTSEKPRCDYWSEAEWRMWYLLPYLTVIGNHE